MVVVVVVVVVEVGGGMLLRIVDHRRDACDWTHYPGEPGTASLADWQQAKLARACEKTERPPLSPRPATTHGAYYLSQLLPLVFHRVSRFGPDRCAYRGPPR